MSLDRHIDGDGALKFFAQDRVAHAQRVVLVQYTDPRRVDKKSLRPEQAQTHHDCRRHPDREGTACHATADACQYGGCPADGCPVATLLSLLTEAPADSG